MGLKGDGPSGDDVLEGACKCSWLLGTCVGLSNSCILLAAAVTGLLAASAICWARKGDGAEDSASEAGRGLAFESCSMLVRPPCNRLRFMDPPSDRRGIHCSTSDASSALSRLSGLPLASCLRRSGEKAGLSYIRAKAGSRARLLGNGWGLSGELRRDEAGERDPGGLAAAESVRWLCVSNTMRGPPIRCEASEEESDQSSRLVPG